MFCAAVAVTIVRPMLNLTLNSNVTGRGLAGVVITAIDVPDAAVLSKIEIVPVAAGPLIVTVFRTPEPALTTVVVGAASVIFE